jgi:hypothetical protein
VAKWGAGESYFLGVTAAACVLAGQATAWLLRVAPRTAPYALGTGLALQALVLAHGPISQTLAWLPDRGPQAGLLGRAPSEEDARAGESIVGQMRRFGGPVLSEDPSFAVAAGKPLVGNATHLRNLYQAGLWDPAPLVSDLQARRYAVVVLNAQLYPQPVLAALGRAYYLASSVRMNGATYQLFLPGRAE